MVFDQIKKRFQRRPPNHEGVDQISMECLDISEEVDTNANPLPQGSANEVERQRPTEATGAIPKNSTRPTEATGAIPKTTTTTTAGTHQNTPPARPPRRRRWQSLRYPLPGETEDGEPASPSTHVSWSLPEDANTENNNPNALVVPPRQAQPCNPGSIFEDQLRKFKPRRRQDPSQLVFRPPIPRLAPVYENVSYSNPRQPRLESLSSALAESILSEASREHTPHDNTANVTPTHVRHQTRMESVSSSLASSRLSNYNSNLSSPQHRPMDTASALPLASDKQSVLTVKCPTLAPTKITQYSPNQSSANNESTAAAKKTFTQLLQLRSETILSTIFRPILFNQPSPEDIRPDENSCSAASSSTKPAASESTKAPESSSSKTVKSSSRDSLLELASNHDVPNQLGGPYKKFPKSPTRSIEYFQRQARSSYVSNPPPRMQRDYTHNEPKPPLPSIESMSITMNPDFINDGVDFVEVNAGQKSAAEEKRLSALIQEHGARSSSMPPLEMPPRIVHGNISHASPAYAPDIRGQRAAPFVRRCDRDERSPSSEPASSASVSESTSSQCSDSGCVSSVSGSVSQSHGSSLSSVFIPPSIASSREYSPAETHMLSNGFAGRFMSINEQMEIPPTDNSSELCYECVLPILRCESACQAMDRIYHTKCFRCPCGENLSGKDFYVSEKQIVCRAHYLKDGKPYSTQCHKCGNFINDMVLVAMGNPYHENCFRCVRCETKLEGIYFTADVQGKLHCDPCFHEKYSPKCSSCKKTIHPPLQPGEVVRVVSRLMEYHYECYRCESCRHLLTSEEINECYPLGEHLFCLTCNEEFQASQLPEGYPITRPEAVSCTHC